MTLTSGTAGLKPGKDAAVGGALNGGVLSLTQGLATDLAAKKIRVNTVVPGLVKTELWDKMGRSAEEQEATFKKATESMPVGFVATGEDIAEAYLYAARAGYATGTLIVIGEFLLLVHPVDGMLTAQRWWPTLGMIRALYWSCRALRSSLTLADE